MLEESLFKKASLLLENTHDIILFFSSDGQILDVNNAAINNYGYNQEEFKQIKVFDLVYNSQHDWEEQLNLYWEGISRFETNHRRKDGTNFPVEVTLQRVILDEEIIFFAMIRNITEQKQVETEKRLIQLVLMALQKFTSSRNIDLNERMNGILKMGSRWLGLEMSAVGEIKDNKYYPIFTYAKQNIMPILKKGDIFDLSVTYCGRTFANQKITYITAAGQSKEWSLHPLYQAFKIESYIGVPIFVKGKVYGTLCFFGLKERLKEFTNYEKELVKLMAQGMGAEIQHQQAEVELIKSQNRLALLNTISNSITLGIPIEQILSNTIQHIYQYFPNVQVAYGVFERDNNLNIIYSYEPETMATIIGEKLNFSQNPEIINRLQENEPLIIEDLGSLPELLSISSKLFVDNHIKSILYVPVKFSDKLVALLCFNCDDAQKWHDDEIDTLTELSDYISLALKQDYTQQKRKHAVEALLISESRFRNLVETTSDLVWEINEKYIYTYVSPKIKEILGYNPEELLGKSAIDLILNPQISEEIKSFSCLEKTIMQKQGNLVILESSGVPMWDQNDNFRGYHGISRDVTERKQIEAEMKKAIAKEKELTDIKAKFVTMTSHELRTPLAGILASAGLLKQYGDKLSEEKKQRHFTKIEEQVKKMTDLMEDVLTLGKVESGKIQFNPEKINLPAFCQEILSEVKMSLKQEHKYNFSYEGNQENIYADEKLLRHILINLLSNAAKYSPEKQPIDFTVILENNHSIFIVRDYGIGIPPEDQKNLFDTFYRARNVGNITGTGLGLAIVKKSVDLHGGTINCLSKIGEGTTFTVNIAVNVVQQEKEKFNLLRQYI